MTTRKTTHKASGVPRVIHLKPKPKPGGKIDTPGDKATFSVGMKLLHLIAAHPMVTVFIVTAIVIAIMWLIWSAFA